MQTEPTSISEVTGQENQARRPSPRLLLKQFLTRPNCRLIIEAEDQTQAAEHYQAILRRRHRLPPLIKLRPRLFLARCAGSGRFWIFQRT